MAFRPVVAVLLCAALSGQAFGQAAMSELQGLRDIGNSELVYDGARPPGQDKGFVTAAGSKASSQSSLTLTGQAGSSSKTDLQAKGPPKPAGEKKQRSTTGGQIRGGIIGFLMGFATGAVAAWGLGLPLLAVLAIGAAVGVPGALIGNDVGKACALDDECS